MSLMLLKFNNEGKQEPPAEYVYIAAIHDVGYLEETGQPTNKYFVYIDKGTGKTETIDCGFDPAAANEKATQLCQAQAARKLTIVNKDPMIAIDLDKFSSFIQDRSVAILDFNEGRSNLPIYHETKEDAQDTIVKLTNKLFHLKAGIIKPENPRLTWRSQGNIITPDVFKR